MSYGRERKPPPNIDGMHSLKVDNIAGRTGPNEIREAFSKFGEIGDVYIPKDRWTGEHKGFAFVRFWARRDAEEALDRMDGSRVDGREVRVTSANYGRPCDEREERRGRGGGGGGYGRRDRDSGRRRSRSRSRSRSGGDRRRNRSKSRSVSKERRRKSVSRSRSKSRSADSPKRSPHSRSRTKSK